MSTRELFCPTCHVGRLHVRKVTYTQVFDGHLVVIANASALVCDICGERVFDNDMLSWLSGLLGPDQGHTRQVPRPV
jgi:YgiT-type zinc finger domain-containing protein